LDNNCSVHNLFAAVVSASPVLAQEGQPQTTPQGLTFFTRYPAQEAAIGEDITFGLTLRTGVSPQTVRLSLQDLPKGWTTTFRGGGRVVQAAYVEPENDTSVDLRVEPPKDVTAGTYRFSVIAQGEGEKAELPIQLQGAILGAPLPLSQSLLLIWPHLTGLIAATILLFALGYVLFQRQEIRA
jgi:hypothetical protein